MKPNLESPSWDYLPDSLPTRAPGEVSFHSLTREYAWKALIFSMPWLILCAFISWIMYETAGSRLPFYVQIGIPGVGLLIGCLLLNSAAKSWRDSLKPSLGIRINHFSYDGANVAIDAVIDGKVSRERLKSIEIDLHIEQVRIVRSNDGDNVWRQGLGQHPAWHLEQPCIGSQNVMITLKAADYPRPTENLAESGDGDVIIWYLFVRVVPERSKEYGFAVGLH